MTPIPLSSQEATASCASKLARIASVNPYLIDATLRENSVGSQLGLTVENKLLILPLLRDFGFERILLGALNYAMPDELTVEDDFMIALRDRGVDRSGCFALTDPGCLSEDGSFTPSLSQRRLRDYQVPNTLHEIYLTDEGMLGQYTHEGLLASLPLSVDWLLRSIKGDGARPPEILINIVDGCDAFSQHPERVEQTLRLLGSLPIAGVSIEDGRGTFMPFQVGSFFSIARSLLPERMALLAHAHAGAGYENASLIEALLNGADGAWGGLPKRTALIGHASLGELIANLARAGNPHMSSSYKLRELLPLCSRLAELIDGEPAPDDLPILGARAYRLSLGFFRQKKGRFMDLPPEAIGGAHAYRVCPVISDPEAISGRLAEITNQPPSDFPRELAEQMIRLMRQDLREGQRIAYDTPENLLRLHQRANTALSR